MVPQCGKVYPFKTTLENIGWVLTPSWFYFKMVFKLEYMGDWLPCLPFCEPNQWGPDGKQKSTEKSSERKGPFYVPSLQNAPTAIPECHNGGICWFPENLLLWGTRGVWCYFVRKYWMECPLQEYLYSWRAWPRGETTPWSNVNLDACIRTSKIVVVRIWVNGTGDRDLVVTKSSIRREFRKWLFLNTEDCEAFDFWKEGHTKLIIAIHWGPNGF